MSTCRSCPAYDPLGSTCRADTPKLNLLPGPNGEPLVVLWPKVQPSFWCMQHPDRAGKGPQLVTTDHPPFGGSRQRPDPVRGIEPGTPPPRIG